MNWSPYGHKCPNWRVRKVFGCIVLYEYEGDYTLSSRHTISSDLCMLGG